MDQVFEARRKVKTNTRQALYWSLASLAVGQLTPSAVLFCLDVFVAHDSPLASIADILSKQFAEGHNFFLLGAFGLIPFFVLSIVLLITSRRLTSYRLACVAVGGLIGILALMVPAHISVWYPLYVGEHMSSTAVIAFIFIPFYCIPPLAIGLLFGWMVSLSPILRTKQSVKES
jgi:hypothetical protein